MRESDTLAIISISRRRRRHKKTGIKKVRNDLKALNSSDNCSGSEKQKDCLFNCCRYLSYLLCLSPRADKMRSGILKIKRKNSVTLWWIGDNSKRMVALIDKNFICGNYNLMSGYHSI